MVDAAPGGDPRDCAGLCGARVGVATFDRRATKVTVTFGRPQPTAAARTAVARLLATL